MWYKRLVNGLMEYKPVISELKTCPASGLKRIKLSFCGLLGFEGESVALWNVEQSGTRFPLFGTVSERSLRQAGYFVPPHHGFVRGQTFASES
jgi:hypothetical protein